MRLIPAHAGKTGLSFVELQGAWAHPRSRGENGYQVVTDHDDVGSSPLTRGKRIRALIQARHDGLIPAHAGKTRPDRSQNTSRQAHPRSRGENEMTNVYLGTAGGSSPLTRGKRAGCAAGSAASGLIPAHAGKTSRNTSPALQVRAHPRSRGENFLPDTSVQPLPGSSPLTRGKPAPDAIVQEGGGLIPAHAGKTGLRPQKMSRGTAHPRSRGENPDRSSRLR